MTKYDFYIDYLSYMNKYNFYIDYLSRNELTILLACDSSLQ